MADYKENPPAVSIKAGPDDSNVIRIDAAMRLRWVCASDHDHRFRFTAWLCGLLKGVK